MQKNMQMTIHSLKSKLEIKFQYGGCLFSKTWSSFISAVDWDISPKSGSQIDFHLLKQIQSLNLNPEIHFRLYGCQLEKSIIIIVIIIIIICPWAQRQFLCNALFTTCLHSSRSWAILLRVCISLTSSSHSPVSYTHLTLPTILRV